MKRRAQLALVAGLAVVLAIIIGAMFTDRPPTRQAADQLPTTAPATTAPAGGQPATEQPPPTPDTATAPAGDLTDGIYEVGREIPAGTYVTTAGDRPCYWARLRSFGQADSIIDDRNVEPGQGASVNVRPSDRGFKVSNGCTWRSVL